MDEKVLDAAQELYELLMKEENSAGDGDVFKQLRGRLLAEVGRERLPEEIRESRTLAEANANIDSGEGRFVDRVRIMFQPLFAYLESNIYPAEPRVLYRPRRPLKQHQPDPSSPRIFISHRSDDLQLAQALVDLLVISMRLEPEVVRCTSVPGHDLRGGEQTDNRLRKEIAEAEIFLALVTPASLRSHFVLFELGARWGIEPLLGRDPAEPPRFIPIIGRGLDAGKLPRPLANFNCLDLREDGDVSRLLAEVAAILGVTLTAEAARARHMRRVTAKASDVPTAGQFPEHEQRILRALFSETEGRELSWYRQNEYYQKALASLISRELVREQNGKFLLRSKGRAAAAAYLASLLENE
jgi:hypothetical protein